MQQTSLDPPNVAVLIDRDNLEGMLNRSGSDTVAVLDRMRYYAGKLGVPKTYVFCDWTTRPKEECEAFFKAGFRLIHCPRTPVIVRSGNGPSTKDTVDGVLAAHLKEIADFGVKTIILVTEDRDYLPHLHELLRSYAGIKLYLMIPEMAHGGQGWFSGCVERVIVMRSILDDVIDDIHNATGGIMGRPSKAGALIAEWTIKCWSKHLEIVKLLIAAFKDMDSNGINRTENGFPITVVRQLLEQAALSVDVPAGKDPHLFDLLVSKALLLIHGQAVTLNTDHTFVRFALQNSPGN